MKNKLLAPYDWFLIVGIIAVNLIYNILADEIDILGSVAGIAGVLCVVLVAKGSILNYLFGLINVSLYGDAALNALYYVPMQFIGYFAWKRRVNDTQVQARRLTLLQRLLVAVGCAVAVVAVAFILKACGAGQPFKDSATTVLSVVAQILMAMAFMEQWVLWILTNIISVVMWVIFALEGEPHAEMMVIMWVFYLMNSINGLRVWLKLSGGSEAQH